VFTFLVRPDAKDSETYLAEIAQGGLGADRDYYFRDDARAQEQRDAYAKYVQQVPCCWARAHRRRQVGVQVLVFGTELARAQMNAVERRDIDAT
jgi:predicted metalloendopeptidase